MSRVKHEPEYRRNRPLALSRDNNCCVKCGSELGLEVHHIEGYKNAKLDALATLCYLCHNIAPMGMTEFAQWLLIGESGIESVERKLSQNGVNKLSRDTVWKVLSALVDLGIETSKLRLKAGRDRIKKSGIKCEGVKGFGYFPEEKPVLERMKSLRSTGMTYDNIADKLNRDGISSRKNKKWMGCTINKILRREVPELQENLLRKKAKQEKLLDNILRLGYNCDTKGI